MERKEVERESVAPERRRKRRWAESGEGKR